MPNELGTMWTSNSKYVDVETGEEIKKSTAISEKYIIIKTNKNVTFNINKTKGHIEYTIECRRNPQITLF